MKESFSLKILAPDSILFSGDVKMVTLPGIYGEFSILPGHNSLMSVLKPGVITILQDQTIEIKITEGFAQVDASSSEVIILL